MERISTKKFASVFRDIHKSSTDRRFCFILGAGASKSSGIPTGFDLANDWLEDIKENETKDDFDKWVKENKIDVKHIGNHYGVIYKKRFSLDEQSGYDILNKVMEHAKPSFGYSVLAQLLSSSQHNIVITTNFDSLMEEALFTFSYKRPLVCGHESLTGYAKASYNRPLIAKIHRDLLLHPMSNPNDIQLLADGWSNALDGVFNTSIPVVIGYGGNDGSLMSYLKNKKGLGNFFWCVRKSDSPKKEVIDVLKNSNGKLVEIEDFDSLMFDLLEALDLNLLDKELEQTAKKRAEEYRDSVKKIKEAKEKSPDIEDQVAAEKLYEKTESDSPWNFILRSQSEKDKEKKKGILEEGIKKFPQDIDLLNEIVWQLILDKDDTAMRYIEKAFALNVNDVIANGHYAVFLQQIKRDYDEAEKYYEKTLILSPKASFNISNYANFLRYSRKNYDKAEKYYKEALQINPSMAVFTDNYAHFLKDIRENYIEAEKYYKQSLKMEPQNANYNGNYAGFLLGLNRAMEGKKYLDTAFSLRPKEDLELELWFYSFAHIVESMKDAEEKIKELLKEGARSEGWDFSLNIETAIKNKHPYPERLKEYAELITTPVK
ncbi:MAG: hypothetical protein V4620_05380 [Bacteroidota bacterium]